MSWRSLVVSACATHHVDEHGQPAYTARFDEVLKFHAPGLAPVRQETIAWHVRSDGAAAYERRFVRTFGFYEDRAAVVAAEGWHHITPSGEDAYPTRFAWCGNFQNGACAVRDHDGAYFHVCSRGEPAYPQRWRYVGDFRDGIAVVQASDGLSTHVDSDGRLLHGRWFVDLDVFHKGFARARDDDGWMHVDSSGRPAYRRRFAAVEPFYNGQARVECFDGSFLVVEESGATQVELRPARRSELAALSADMVGFWRTHAIATAVELGVIEALPGASSRLAECCGLREDTARRLLRALGELGLVRVGESDVWHLTSRGALLRRDHPQTLADAALEYAGPFTKMWQRLPDALRGSSWEPPDVFGEVAGDERRREGHHRMLRSYARHDYDGVVPMLHLRGDERVVDAGGGLGVLAQAIVDAHPAVHVTVLERPEVVVMAASQTSGVRWQAGSLFEPWNLAADAVVLTRVLHDWDDSQTHAILMRAREAVAPGARLYVVEMVLSDDTMAGSLCDLHLLVATGGRERTLDAYRRLFASADFELTEVRRVPTLPSILVAVAT